MRIVSASIQNFKRIEVIEIEPDGSVIEVTGANEQGKSSVLDAIEAALGGKRHEPAQPIRRGAEEEGARVVLDLGDLVVERRWSAASDRLVLKTPDGASFPKAQSRLDQLIGGLAFDPLEFMTKKPSEQRETLLELAGVDLDEIEARRVTVYQERRTAGRILKAAQARLDGAPTAAADTPEEEIDVAALNTELRTAVAEMEENHAARQKVTEKEQDAKTAAALHARKLEDIAALERELLRARTRCEELAKMKTSTRTAARKARAEVLKLIDPDMSAIQERIESAAAVNREVGKLRERKGLEFEVKRLEIEHESQEEQLAAIEEEKRRALAEADMPIDGLEVTDEGVLFEGLPLDQASMSRRVRICTAISAALAPELQIALVRSGNDLDRESLAAFYSYCQEVGLQAWVERIDGITDDALVIEAGRLEK